MRRGQPERLQEASGFAVVEFQGPRKVIGHSAQQRVRAGFRARKGARVASTRRVHPEPGEAGPLGEEGKQGILRGAMGGEVEGARPRAFGLGDGRDARSDPSAGCQLHLCALDARDAKLTSGAFGPPGQVGEEGRERREGVTAADHPAGPYHAQVDPQGPRFVPQLQFSLKEGSIGGARERLAHIHLALQREAGARPRDPGRGDMNETGRSRRDQHLGWAIDIQSVRRALVGRGAVASTMHHDIPPCPSERVEAAANLGFDGYGAD